MNLYYLIDALFISLILYLSYYCYKNRLYEKIFDYIKIFILISISAKFSVSTGILLKKIGLILPDTYAVLILMGFLINYIIFYYLYHFLQQFFKYFIHQEKIKSFIAKIVSFVEVLLLVSFILFLFMQLSISKKHFYPIINQSYSYKYIKKFYHKFLNDEFVYMIINSDTKTNHQEIILRSFKNSF